VTSPAAAGDDVRTVAGEGIVLRPFTADDVPSLAAAFADPAVVRWNPGPSDADGVRAWLERRNDWSDGTHASWAVGDATGALLGSVSLHALDADQRDAEVGYWTAPGARGRGTTTRAVRTAVGVAFTALGLHRVHLLHAVENEASCRVAQRSGFVLEGRLRRSYRYPDGLWHDEHLHARLDDDPDPGGPADPAGDAG
jgi:RimJ/RimL family protein N-acetyltransferase